ncbi:hypothetical protein K435DRAFT_804335 [Dendrothele bispora CBS 962.96]|uniref:Uncharacterized protein n=1 Tax=Dendrothele bispora (strain CBS 962.96) TaxID=1314807 RepID=A0A4S8LEQ7_DENBC|nr:hypothetical protein K435DRAFT_804335 [Dendrothele bispora CBS 962.96]
MQLASELKACKDPPSEAQSISTLLKALPNTQDWKDFCRMTRRDIQTDDLDFVIWEVLWEYRQQSRGDKKNDCDGDDDGRNEAMATMGQGKPRGFVAGLITVLEISVAIKFIKTRFCPGMDGSKTLTNQEKMASLKKLRQIINAGAPPQQRNTFFVTTAPEQVSKETSKRLEASYSPQKLIAVGDYLFKTEANSIKVGNLIDNALAAEAKKGKFSLAAGKSIKDTWGVFLEWYKEVVTVAEADMNAAAQASNPGQK